MQNFISHKKPAIIRWFTSLTSWLLLACLPILIGAKVDESRSKETAKDPIFLQLTRVIDGSSFVEGNFIIRLWGIEAPREGEEYYLAAKLYLSVLLESAPHSCYFQRSDGPGPVVARCFTGEEDIAKMLIRAGVAKDDPEISSGYYAADEAFAKADKIGMWSDGKN